MYWVPIVMVFLLALIAVAWSPVFALIIAVPAFIGFLVYIGLRPRADGRLETPRGSAGRHEDETPKGMWGEPRP
jgi:hypothetical protein